MAHGHANASCASAISDSSSTLYYSENSLYLNQYLSYNVPKNRFSWNGTLEDLETIVHTKLSQLIDDGGNDDKSTKSYNSSCAILSYLLDITPKIML